MPTTGSYSPRFFRFIEEESLASARVVLPMVLGEVQPCSVLDVGCGTGAWLQVCRDLGVEEIFGVDGYSACFDQVLVGPEHFQTYDLSRPLDLGHRFDLVISLEVAEHLPPAAAPVFVASLCRHADTVLFSAAIPGQGGTGHLNERWQSYWATLFADQGFSVSDPFRPRLWDHDDVAFWYRQNLLLYRRGPATGAPVALDLVHPALHEAPRLRHSLYLCREKLARRTRSELARVRSGSRP